MGVISDGTTMLDAGEFQGLDVLTWDTTAKTASFTGVAGNGYFVNTTSGAITLTLPASPSAGDQVGVKDYAYTFNSNNLIVNRNGSPFGGGSDINTINYDVDGSSLLFIYVDGTKGWLAIQDSTNTDSMGATFITATGGSITTSGDYKIHTFTSPGTFTVTSLGNPVGSDSVSYLTVGGGAGGGCNSGGAGGAGGFREGYIPGSYSASPLATSALPVAAQSYPITVGAGGSGAPGGGRGFDRPESRGGQGSNSVFSTITSAGGGSGGAGLVPSTSLGIGGDGGSGGGGGCDWPVGNYPGGAGNTPPVSPSQGSNGGIGFHDAATAAQGGAGGGATSAGGNSPIPGPSGNGGNGATSSITGSPVTRAGGGGGGGGGGNAAGSGGPGGGGAGGPPGNPGSNATTNTGGGGGGASGEDGPNGGNGGSGIVIIRYKYQ